MEASKERSRVRNGLINSAMVVGSLIVVFIFLEAGFRLHGVFERRSQTSTESWAIHDEDLGYRPRPSFADFNSHGLRDDPIAPLKSEFRILMLGDSVTFYGDDIDDTYVGYLEDRLGSDSETQPSEVINAGVRGYTNYQQLVYLRKFGLELQPDLVGVGFVLNDMQEILHKFELDEDGQIVGEYVFVDEVIDAVDSPLYRLARKSQFLVWCRHNLSVLEDLVALYAEENAGYTFEYRPDFNSAWDEAAWPTIKSQLEEMAILGREHDFKLFLVVFPFGEQYREDYLVRDEAYVLMPQDRLRHIASELGVPFLDLYSALDPREHLEEDNIHLTKAGRSRVANEIYHFLKAEALVPAAVQDN